MKRTSRAQALWAWFRASSQEMPVVEYNLGEGPGEGEGRQVREGRREREEGDIRREQRTESANTQMVETPHDKPQLCPIFWGPIKLMDLGWNRFKSALEARWEAYVTLCTCKL